MTPEEKEMLLGEWRAELKAKNYFLKNEYPPVVASGYFKRSHNHQAAHFRGRVMRHLSRRGLRLKEIAYVWGIHLSSAFNAMQVDLVEFPSRCIALRVE